MVIPRLFASKGWPAKVAGEGILNARAFELQFTVFTGDRTLWQEYR